MKYPGQFRGGHYYQQGFISASDKKSLVDYLQNLQPIWEMRYSKNNPPPVGQIQRRLLRPVYWLGNWQFACLNYYHPPKGILHRCVQGEPYPTDMARIVHQIEQMVHNMYSPTDVPRGWHLNTCLVNYYGDQITADGKKIDCARVGEHKDFEPGPVASISFGEKALIQFVRSQSTKSQSEVVQQQWLDDSCLQIFGSNRYKNVLFHRVQRVDRKSGIQFKEIDQKTPGFTTRRINLTFRYVPTEHIESFKELPKEQQEDVIEYIQELAKKSDFFAKQME